MQKAVTVQVLVVFIVKLLMYLLANEFHTHYMCSSWETVSIAVMDFLFLMKR